MYIKIIFYTLTLIVVYRGISNFFPDDKHSKGHLKLKLLTQFPASNDEKYINVVYIWRKFVSFYGYVHWRMTTEIPVMYGSEKVNCKYYGERSFLRSFVLICLSFS